MSTDPAWRFRRMHPGEMNIDPIEAEFFSTEALDSLADALVRESVQNSLDARRPGHAVRMRYAFSGKSASLRDEPRYLAGLGAHLHASRSGLIAAPATDEPLSWLLVEDFGTRGLQGDPAQSEDAGIETDAAARNDFFYFWRNVGRSRKQAAELGRWGLGKTVFQAASRINGFFGYTMRADDRRRMLLGQAVLKIHKIGDQRFYPYGYFGCLDGDFALPSEDPEWLDQFAADFALARDDRPGLSIVVPYPDSAITPEAITESVVRHYFLPIIAGDLIVEIVNGDETAVLDTTSLGQFVVASGGIDTPRLFKLARWALDARRDEHWSLPRPPRASAPRWARLDIDEGELTAQRRAFDAGEPVAVTIPVWVKPADETPVLSSFDLYLERDEDGHSEQHYVRDGITIAGVRVPLPKGIRALLLVRDGPLSRLLGDSENPAHTEWQERSPKFKDRYRHGPFTLRYIKNAPREIVRLLTRPVEGRDFQLLRQVFSLDVPNEESMRVRGDPTEKPGSGGEAGETGAIDVGGDQSFRLHKLHDGFRLSGAGNGAGVPRQTAVWAAYDVRRGNPFRQWQAPDFELNQAPIAIEVDGAELLTCQHNVLVLRLNGGEFSVTVKGFDQHRDVRVRVAPVEDGRA